ncbi:hypothetical protein M0804_000017 [Polistes exclamans]|nr:hypothetical protein M0804_000017 [Polistes exclamans]
MKRSRSCDLRWKEFGNLRHLITNCTEIENDIILREIESGRNERKIINWLRKLQNKKEEKQKGDSKYAIKDPRPKKLQ